MTTDKIKNKSAIIGVLRNISYPDYKSVRINNLSYALNTNVLL